MRVLENILAAEGDASARGKVVFHELAQVNPHASQKYTYRLIFTWTSFTVYFYTINRDIARK